MIKIISQVESINNDT